MVDDDPRATGSRSHLLDLALLLAENLRALLVVPIVAGALALAISFIVSPTYTAVARVLPPTQQQGTSALAGQLGALAGLVGAMAPIKSAADTYVGLLKSHTVFNAIATKFDLKAQYKARFREDLFKELERRTRFIVGSKDGIITIEVDDDDPKRAAAMANAFVEELQRVSNTLAVTEAGQRRLFFERQLAQAKDNLTKSEVALRSSGVSEAVLRTVPQSTLEALARLKAQIMVQDIRVASMRTYMTDANPDLKLAMQELAALRSELSKAERSVPDKASQEGAEYVARYRDFKYHETLFELMAKQFEVARLEEAREGAVIQVVDNAVAPERASKPKKALIAVLTALVAFFMTILVLLVIHAVRSSATIPDTQDKLSRLARLLRLRRSN